MSRKEGRKEGFGCDYTLPGVKEERKEGRKDTKKGYYGRLLRKATKDSKEGRKEGRIQRKDTKDTREGGKEG